MQRLWPDFLLLLILFEYIDFLHGCTLNLKQQSL